MTSENPTESDIADAILPLDQPTASVTTDWFELKTEWSGHPDDGMTLTIYHFRVFPDCRNQGIASKTISVLEDHARQNGATSIGATIQATTPATKHVLESAGFETHEMDESTSARQYADGVIEGWKHLS